ncbi:MAG: TIGR02757 family protein [Chitinophagaceae bacterium]
MNAKVEAYNKFSFIAADPISIPHRFSRKQDIEISGFFAAIFSWGNRTTIIRKSTELMQAFDNSPHDFLINHSSGDLRRFLDFKHRTFNATDLLYFIDFLSYHYRSNKSLESAFTCGLQKQDKNIEKGLIYFRQYFFSLEDAPSRTKKHISSPESNSTCKRLSMFLRWMVRNDKQGVDFGIWKNILPSQLICPVDLHVARVARKFGLLTRQQTDWQAAVELTNYLKRLDSMDPVKYDFALFGLGVLEKF